MDPVIRVNVLAADAELDRSEEGKMSNPTIVSNQVSPLRTDSGFRKAEVLTSLRLLGADEYDLLLPETHCLPRLIRPGETVFGVVYGRYVKGVDRTVGRGMLVITNQRVMLVDKKPLFEETDDLTFGVISGVDYGQVGPAATVTLHTRRGDISVRTFNKRCGREFVQAVQDMLYQARKGYTYDYQDRTRRV
jgi:hypothetical protein